MLEIEMKFRVDDFGAIRQNLENWNAKEQPAIEESDHYFNAPDRDFAKTDEAFRLRCIGANNRITYKGPKQGGPAKTRTEIEIGIAPGADVAEQFRRLVQSLGYRPTAVVTKCRTIFEFERQGYTLQVCLDEVATLGSFVEVEIVAEPHQRHEAEQLLLKINHELGLSRLEPRSYLEMVLATKSTGTA